MSYKDMTQQTREFVNATMANAVREHFIDKHLKMEIKDDCIELTTGKTFDWAIVRNIFPVVECFGLYPQVMQDGLNIIVKIG